ncbi:MAG: cupin domain-containing protein [Candidatus Sungbacteria bacterium]|uniref:Cupin domain-containing protein n=1 Tax=Candidatus Sungiibacteriota bacterium TaxID=2750080 RepID=A0A932QXN0_9BACT|nr:cupin domain-containing protein [Candidatus Sungbacteria bacterium]
MILTKNITPKFVDVRGAITKILDNGTPIKSILLITSHAGAVRANHYHKKDSHYSYLLSGKMEYSEKPVAGGQMERAVLSAGDMVFTPPQAIHAMRFLEDSSFLALATESRSQEDYEADTVRIELVRP